jgi:SAM-dependent methyltransferase
MTQIRQRLSTWEKAEVERSSIEAAATSDAALRVKESTIARYAAPPSSTAYPLEYAYHLLGNVRGRTVVDFGCGSGANTVLLTGRGAHVIAVDISTDLVRLGERRLTVSGRAGQAHFVVGSAHDLPLPDESVDVVFGMAILHHLDLDLVSREVFRILKPGGRAIFEEPVRNSRLLRALRRVIPIRDPDVSPFERPLTDDELRRFSAPFLVAHSRAFSLPHVRVAERAGAAPVAVARAYASDRRLLERWPVLRRFAAVRVFEIEKAGSAADSRHTSRRATAVA